MRLYYIGKYCIFHLFRFSSSCLIFVLFNYKNLEIALEFTCQSDCVSISLQRKKRCITWIWISEIEHDHLFIQMLICNFRIQQEIAIHTWISKIREISHFFSLYALFVGICRKNYVRNTLHLPNSTWKNLEKLLQCAFEKWNHLIRIANFQGLAKQTNSPEQIVHNLSMK